MQSKHVVVGQEYAALTRTGTYSTAYRVRVTGPAREEGRYTKWFPVEFVSMWNEREGVEQPVDVVRMARPMGWGCAKDGTRLIPARYLAGPWSDHEQYARAEYERQQDIRSGQIAADDAFSAALSRLRTAATVGRPNTARRTLVLDTKDINALADLLVPAMAGQEFPG